MLSPAFTVTPPQHPARQRANLGRVDLRLDPNIPSEAGESLPDTTSSKKGPLARSHDQNESPCGSPARIHLARPLRVSCDSKSCFRLRAHGALPFAKFLHFFTQKPPSPGWIFDKKRKKLARIMLLINHYILWLVKKNPQHRDFFLTFWGLKNKKHTHLPAHAVDCMRKDPPTQFQTQFFI